MFKKAGLSALSALFSVSLASAAGFDLNSASLDLKERLSNIQAPAAQAPGKGAFDWLRPAKAPKEWTIMVFINGKNNLEPYALKDMNEMELAGSTDKINIVTETGRIDGYDDSEGDWKGTRRYLITKDADTEKLSSKMVQDLGKTDMGDYKSVAAFGLWAKKNYPAKKYMLIVWNHGSGWEKGLRRGVDKGISYDDETDNHITTPQLGLALKGMGGVDVYGSDACLMQMPEVDYELKDSAAYIVGSEETEPGDGYTYNTFLAPVAARPEMTPAELAKTAVDAYSDHYNQQGTGSTQSFIKTAALPGFVAKVNAWVDAVMAAGLKAEVASARTAAMSYAISENKDLVHLVNLVAGKTQDAAVKAKSADLVSYIVKELVQHNRYNNQPDNGGGDYDDWDYKASRWGGKDYSESHGIAVYLPGSAPAAAYGELAWASASKWDEFITWSVAK
ncbi:MAG TPA: clostripain-related cysteine peptidase [Elusimicrobiales bacterium]|nr:clostripain-related cysteine peptidase [Elusimicrobiales bacterium]